MPNFKPYAERAKEHGLSIKKTPDSLLKREGAVYSAFTSRGRVTDSMTETEVFWFLVGFLQGKVGTSAL